MFSQEEDTKQPIRDSLEKSRDRTAKKRASRYYRFSICTVSQLSWPTFGGSYCTGWFIWSDSWVGLTLIWDVPSSARCSASSANFPSAQAEPGLWWRSPNQSQPNPANRPDGSPCSNPPPPTLLMSCATPMTSSVVPLKMGTQSMLLGSNPSDSERAVVMRSHCDTLLTFRIWNAMEEKWDHRGNRNQPEYRTDWKDLSMTQFVIYSNEHRTGAGGRCASPWLTDN